MQEKMLSVKFIEKCYKLYEQKMYQVSYGILRDSGLAEDAVQEAFMKLMNSKKCFKDAKSDDCKRYIITIIKNSSITIYNKKKKEQKLVYLTDEDHIHEQVEDQHNVFDKNEIEELLVKLPDKYYSVVECMVIEDMSVKETAKKLMLTEANVRKRFERAKILLKTVVKGGNEYEERRELYKSGIN